MAENFSASGGESQITEFKILGDGKNGSLTITPFIFNYYESLLEHTVRCTVQVADTGYRSTGGSAVSMSPKDINGRYVNFKVIDGIGNKLEFSGENKLRISFSKNAQESTNKTFFSFNLASPEYYDNPTLKCAVTKRYDGHLDLNVASILRNVLKTKKPIYTDPTLNTFNFTGKTQTPFFICTWLASRSIPNLPNANENLAGYLFWETANGYHFKSIDNLFHAQKPKRILISNDIIGDIPPKYNGKILEYSFVETFDLKHLQQVASGQSQIRTWDPFSQKYKESTFDYKSQYLGYNTGGTEPITYEGQENIVRRDFFVLSTGVAPSGGTIKQQVEKSKDTLTYDVYKIERQSRMRDNGLYNIKLSIKIAGDLSLRAGDLIHCDFPLISGEKLKKFDNIKSGIYMIHDVCHHITKNGFFTGMNLVRESIGRKPIK